MRRAIVYDRPDGGISIVHPVINTQGEPAGFAEADAEARAWATVPADALSPRWVEAGDFPQDRSLREAWRHDGEAFSIDLDHARALTKTRLRRERAQLLAAQDIAFLRAQEAGASTTAVVAEKQRLRDVTRLADAAATADELKTLTATRTII